MRHFLSVILSVVVLSVIFVCLEGRIGTRTAITESSEGSVSVTEPSVPSYQKEPIAEYGDIKVYYEYGLNSEDCKYGNDMYYKDDSYLVKHVNDIPKDTMILVGPHSGIFGKGKYCRVIVGVDTIDIDISQPFSRTFDLRYSDAVPGCRRYRLSRHHALNYKSWPTDFQINIAMKEDTPLHIKDFISRMIRNDVAQYFSDYSDSSLIVPNIPSIKMSQRSIDQMMHHYYRQFCKYYDKEFMSNHEPDEPAMGDRYAYQFYAYPMWQSSDTTLTTWRFYNFSYMGGTHGGETDFFLTFNNESGRMLGVSDFYTKADFKYAIAELTRQLNEYFEETHSVESCLEADLEMESGVTTFQNKTQNEKIDGKIYPRPAITQKGIVFSYQKYEKGGNVDGALHFILPFPKRFKF